MTAELLSGPALFLLGLMGAGHCIGMCGGITSALGMAAGGEVRVARLGLVLGYNFGRVFSYSIAGSLVGALGYLGVEYLALKPLLRGLAATLLILMGLYLGDWWRALTVLERLGASLWRRLQPLGNRFLPVTRINQAVAMGMVWGWLPCGLAYSALAYAATSGSPVDGALLMACFGLGTLPAMVLGGVFSADAARLLQKQGLRRMMGVVIILLGFWTLWSGLTATHAGHVGSGAAPQESGTTEYHRQEMHH